MRVNIYESNNNNQISIEIEKNLIIIGANGSGKTRLGSIIEQVNSPSKRISAQRQLSLTPIVSKMDYTTSQSQLVSNYKHRDVIQPINDFDQLLITLFAEESLRNELAISEIKNKGSLAQYDLKKSQKEKLVEIWDFIFPTRILKLEGDSVNIINSESKYAGNQLSDGEKVGLYLIAQVLLAPENCILVIDEPELHLHKSLMVRLWDKLELERTDCVFVYITHDLDFASSKNSSKVIWVREYNGQTWDWQELEPNDIIPEDLYYELLGSRIPILLVEGEKGSLDAKIYQSYYKDFTVIPRGSCEKVIESVKGLNKNLLLHNKKVYGLIDRDFRNDEQIKSLEKVGIFCARINEIENIFLVPEIVQLVCNHMQKSDSFDIIKNKIVTEYKNNKDSTQFKSNKWQIQKTLNEKFSEVTSQETFDTFKSSILSEIDTIYTQKNLPDDDAYINQILYSYPNKGLISKIVPVLGLVTEGYTDLVLAFLTSKERSTIINIFKNYLPEIPTPQPTFSPSPNNT